MTVCPLHLVILSKFLITLSLNKSAAEGANACHTHI